MSLWSDLNRQLVAKAMSELLFEEVLSATALGADQYSLTLASNVVYQFRARTSAWQHLWVDAESLCRSPSQEVSAGQFFIDSLHETQMSEITLGTFLEEMNNTLYSDVRLRERAQASAEEMITWGDTRIQQALPGHPKLLLNKGRMGWGAQDLAHFAPEAQAHFKLRWILVRRELIHQTSGDSFSRQDVIQSSFHGEARARIEDELNEYPASQWELLPVHPWQWDQVIALQFQSELQKMNIIDLGFRGDSYTPLVSLRTLANLSRPVEVDLKLPLTILNTSSVRGLPQRYFPITLELSQKLQALCLSDNLLAHVEVLSEVKATGVRNPLHHQLPGTTYRYHEQLGAVWRESTMSKLKSDEQAFLVAALFHQDPQGQTLLAALAQKSRVSVSTWLTQYARVVIVPLYHLQLKYGIGVVAHGQNIVLKTTRGLPSGLLLKDFHGDLRLSSAHAEAHSKHFANISDALIQLPPEHLIHDLVTGHFITVLRFMARALHESGALTETSFYQIIGAEIAQYQKQHSELVTPATDILAPSFQRVLINKVRFKIGYSDSAERPLPMLGSELINPLAGKTL